MIKVTALFLAFLLTPTWIIGAPLSPNELEKEKNSLSVNLKTHSISSSEQITLYGAKRRKFLTPNWYFGEAGFGAISGKRSGYLEGGVIGGYFKEISPRWNLALELLIGAGGGGSAPQGGGLIICPSIGIGYQFTRTFSIMSELGYSHFINGDISSLTAGLELNMNIWNLNYVSTAH